MRINPIIQRIQAQCPIFKHVGPALSLDPVVKDFDADLPEAYVYAISDKSPANETIQVVTQRRRQRFGVLITARNYDADIEPLADARDQLFAALLGYQPTALNEPVEHEQGDVVEVDGYLIWWRDIFTTSVYMRST